MPGHTLLTHLDHLSRRNLKNAEVGQRTRLQPACVCVCEIAEAMSAFSEKVGRRSGKEMKQS